MDENKQTNMEENATILETQENQNTILEKNNSECTTLAKDSKIETNKTVHNSSSETKKQNRSFLETGEMFLHYKIEKELGRGGMGVVYKALDTKLQRHVALKLILRQHISEQMSKRFIQEAQATARLEHPNIVKLLEIQEYPEIFFTMEFVEGDTLSNTMREGKFNFQKIADIVKKIALAAETAHEAGFIHRDIKPSNIMLTKNDEPKLMDFGLAKNLEVENNLSKTGDMMGTPAYMPPEQAEGGQIGRQSDVYAIGATLYDLLTGRPPFQGESHINILHQIFNAEPLLLRNLNPDIPIDLEAICLKCLEKKIERRYSSAKELAQDLQNYLDHRPVKAYPATSMYLFKRMIMRNLSVAITLSFIVAVLTAGGIFSFVQWQKAEQATVEAELAAVEMQKQKDNANLTLAEIAYKKAEEAKSNQKWQDTGVLAGVTLQYLKNISDNLEENISQEKIILQQKTHSIIAEACANYGLLSQQHIKSRDIPEEKKLTISRDGSLVLLHDHKKLTLWEKNSKGELNTVDLPKSLSLKKRKIEECCFSPDNTILAIGFSDGSICLLQENNFYEYDISDANILTMCFSEDSKILAISDNTKKIVYWDMETKQKHKDKTSKVKTLTKRNDKENDKDTPHHTNESLKKAMFSNNLNYIAFYYITNTKGGDFQSVEVYSTNRSASLLKINCSLDFYGFNHDSTLFIAITDYEKLAVYDLASGDKIANITQNFSGKQVKFCNNENSFFVFDCSSFSKWELVQNKREIPMGQMSQVDNQSQVQNENFNGIDLNGDERNDSLDQYEYQQQFISRRKPSNDWEVIEVYTKEFTSKLMSFSENSNYLASFDNNTLSFWCLVPHVFQQNNFSLRTNLFTREKVIEQLETNPQQITEQMFAKKVTKVLGVKELEIK